MTQGGWVHHGEVVGGGFAERMGRKVKDNSGVGKKSGEKRWGKKKETCIYVVWVSLNYSLFFRAKKFEAKISSSCMRSDLCGKREESFNHVGNMINKLYTFLLHLLLVCQIFPTFFSFLCVSHHYFVFVMQAKYGIGSK